jgi:Gas vesicle synthesis protein GvpL/GvpF
VTTTLASYVYAIVPADTPLPDNLKGIGGTPVALAPWLEVAAVVGAVDPEQPVGRRGDILAHGRVVDALSGLGPVIPIRFGSVFAAETDVVDHLLAPNAGHFLNVLAGLEGTAQFTVRARYDEELVLAEVISENPDIAALRDQTRGQPEDTTYYPRLRLGELVSQALEAKRDDDGQRVLGALVPHTVASKVLPGTGVDHLIEVAFLVADDHRAVFEQVAEDVAASVTPRAKVRLVGPVAPYDFVPEE